MTSLRAYCFASGVKISYNYAVYSSRSFRLASFSSIVSEECRQRLISVFMASSWMLLFESLTTALVSFSFMFALFALIACYSLSVCRSISFVTWMNLPTSSDWQIDFC